MHAVTIEHLVGEEEWPRNSGPLLPRHDETSMVAVLGRHHHGTDGSVPQVPFNFS